jgi:hypothetical protein
LAVKAVAALVVTLILADQMQLLTLAVAVVVALSLTT